MVCAQYKVYRYLGRAWIEIPCWRQDTIHQMVAGGSVMIIRVRTVWENPRKTKRGV